MVLEVPDKTYIQVAIIKNASKNKMKFLKLTVQAMIHGLHDCKCLALTMPTTVVFVPNSICFSICINSNFFKKVIY